MPLYSAGCDLGTKVWVFSAVEILGNSEIGNIW